MSIGLRSIMRGFWFASAVGIFALAGCNKEPQVALHYELAETLDPSLVVRVETRVTVAASDPRAFTADLPYRAVDVGVGYEVRDFDGTGSRILLITHDSALGYDFGARFVFTLLPPVGDAPPLEIQARALGAGLNEVLAETAIIPASFGAGHEVTLPLADLRCGTKSACTGNDSCCGGKCSDVNQDVANCGACGQACGAQGDSCSGGGCRCNGASPCTSGQSCCPGLGCIDTQNDPFNCGACGKSCAAGESCNAGVCSCGGKTCGATQACCNGTCTDGGCSCGAMTCTSAAPLCCNNACVDVFKDNANCGSCGKSCAAPYNCSTGACACRGAVCGSSDTCCASGCKQLATDPLNCGACGKACGIGETCVGGACRCGSGLGCAQAQLCCAAAAGRSCVDPTSDKLNCGACGKVCATTDVCASSTCVCPGTGGQVCGLGQTCCPNSGCYDLSKDDKHCGACGTACATGTTCMTGVCMASTSLCQPSCTNGTVCVGSQCTCNGFPASCSANGQYCCPGAMGCVDTLTDPNNCGQCGRSCASEGKNLCCGGTCYSFDANHCGQCAKCTSPTPNCLLCNGTYSCVSDGSTICVTPFDFGAPTM